MNRTRTPFRLPKLPRKSDARRAIGYRGYRGSKPRLEWWGWLLFGIGLLALTRLIWTLCGAFPAVSSFFRAIARFLSNLLGIFTGI